VSDVKHSGIIDNVVEFVSGGGVLSGPSAAFFCRECKNRARAVPITPHMLNSLLFTPSPELFCSKSYFRETLSMERAARLLNKHKYSLALLDSDEYARAIWPAAVGKAIARHTSRLKVVRDTLVVGVEDAIWQKQLFSLSTQIVHRVQKCMGSTAITQIEFRILPPKREPQREPAPHPASPDAGDDAEAIQDPVLKKVYLLSRKRSTA
jgi:hypothetical protein